MFPFHPPPHGTEKPERPFWVVSAQYLAAQIEQIIGFLIADHRMLAQQLIDNLNRTTPPAGVWLTVRP